MKKILSAFSHCSSLLLICGLFMAGSGVVRAAGVDSTEWYRQHVRIEDRNLRNILMNMTDSSDFAYRQVVIRKLSTDIGAELKDALFQALKSFIVDHGIQTQANVDSTSFVNTVYIYAGVASDSVDIFHIQFLSQRASTIQEVDQRILKATGEVKMTSRTLQIPINYDIIGVNCYDALQQRFTDGVYKGVSVGEVLQQEFLSPLNSEIVDVYGDFGKFGDKIVLNPKQRLKYYNLFTSFYSVAPTYDTLNPRDTTITDTIKVSGKPFIKQRDTMLYDLALSSRVQPIFEQPLLDFSLLHQLTLNPFSDKDFGFQVRLGNDEVGLPFWSSGTGQALLILRDKIFDESVFKLGVVFPFGVGESSSSTLFSRRNLAGGWGFAAEGLIPSFNIPADLNLPLGFSFQYVPSFNKNSTVIDTNPGASIYYASFIGTVYFPFIVDLDPHTRTSFVQLQVGIGWEDINRAVAEYPGMIINGDTVKKGDANVGQLQNLEVVTTRVLPHIRVEYVNHEAAKFGTFFQYDHMWMFGGWIELFNGFRIEAEYAAPFHPANPWEPQSFFLISPRIRIM
ncbi:MAG TPA: hypothetical protein VFJ29_00735 [Candidatus Kapabacteria bacterium]|nr:hypothetical protein [Candidatus Kapabacteria bacterium]